jgi:hypothetical protein
MVMMGELRGLSGKDGYKVTVTTNLGIEVRGTTRKSFGDRQIFRADDPRDTVHFTFIVEIMLDLLTKDL